MRKARPRRRRFGNSERVQQQRVLGWPVGADNRQESPELAIGRAPLPLIGEATHNLQIALSVVAVTVDAVERRKKGRVFAVAMPLKRHSRECASSLLRVDQRT
jgi:hypothetical protein